MKKILIFSGIILLPLLAKCQTDKTSFLMLEVGPSFPVGSFGESDFENDEPGFAVLGVNLEIKYSHELGRNWGYLAALKMNSFPFDENSILEANGYPDDGTWSISSDNYNIYGVYGGLFYECIKRKKFTLRINGMAGLNTISYPATTVKHPANVYFLSSTNGDHAINFSYFAKASACFYLSQKLSLSANIGFMHARAKYDTQWKVTFDYQSWSGKEIDEQPITAIDSAIGLIYKLE